MRGIRTITMSALMALAAACGGSSTVPVLLGPFLVDFESRPDDGFNVLATPLFIGNGATITNVANGSLYDFSTFDNWGLSGCPAIATSGTLLMGAEQSAVALVVVEITFDPPVARVGLQVADVVGALVSLEARDASSALLDADDQLVGPCPIALAPMGVDTGDANLIASIRIAGNAPVWDDLQTWRWSN